MAYPIKGCALLVSVLATTGCAYNSGAVPLGSGVYMVTVENDALTGGVGGAMRRATETARQTCGSREVVPVSTDAVPQQPFRSSSFALSFRCAQ